MHATTRSRPNGGAPLRSRAAGPFALLALLAGLAGCAGNPPAQEILPPDVFLSDVTPVGAGLFEQRIRLRLRVSNPNPFDLRTYGLRFDLAMNGQPLAAGVSNQRWTLPALSEEILEVEASTTTFGLLHQLRRLSERRELTYQLSGNFLLDTGEEAPSLGFERTARLGPAAPEPVLAP